MNDLFPFLLLLVSGAAISLQMTINSVLGRELGLWAFVTIFSLLQFVFSMPTFFALAWPLRLETFKAVPFWYFFGPAMGIPILAAVAFGFIRAGAFTGLACVLVGQMVMGVVIDQFGLLGAPVNPITPVRALGVFSLVLGVFLVKR